MISRLQAHNFKWEDDTLNNLIIKYPNCLSALKWWTNDYGEKSPLSISYNKRLKEFLISNPPKFTISNKCCKYAKKDLAHNKLKEGYDLNITGIRKSEGGVRSVVYKSCFDNTGKGYDNYRPIFWFKDKDKEEYNNIFNIENSKCPDTTSIIAKAFNNVISPEKVLSIYPSHFSSLYHDEKLLNLDFLKNIIKYEV